jgi:hypothetical protein
MLDRLDSHAFRTANPMRESDLGTGIFLIPFFVFISAKILLAVCAEYADKFGLLLVWPKKRCFRLF